ncbi:MAG: S8 family serine peptidase [Armatimonadota bacterium]
MRLLAKLICTAALALLALAAWSLRPWAQAPQFGGPRPGTVRSGRAGELPPGAQPPPRYARGHIVVKLAPGAPPAAVASQATRSGLRLGPVRPGARWTTMPVPPGRTARETAARARALPGIQAAGLDPILRLHQHLSTSDPWAQMPPYGDEPCVQACMIDLFHPDCCLDLFFMHLICHQWGLFHMDIESAWSQSHGSPDIVIAVIDSGVDFDHPDVHHVPDAPNGVLPDVDIDKIWTNPGETPDNGVDDDGNGYTDDVRGWDFCGTDVGEGSGSGEEANAANPGTPAEPGEPGEDSDDNNPDVFAGGGYWVWDDPFDPIYVVGFVGGDPSVGDMLDNNGDAGCGGTDAGVSHGTLVATVATAVTDNVCPDIGYWFDGLSGFAGAGYDCSIMPLRMINAEGVGYGIDGYDAIMYAADNGADILNISWGAVNDPTHPDYDATGVAMIQEAVEYAAAQGCVMICSSGNFGGGDPCNPGWTYTGGMDVPAAFPETISVGAINDLNERSSFSSWAGPGEVLDVVAPGEFISGAAVWSAYDASGYAFLGDAIVTPGDADWDSGLGTSFSAPLVSGLAGLILAAHPTYTPEQVRWVLRNGSIDLGASGYDPYFGYGLARGNVNASPDPDDPTVTWASDLSLQPARRQWLFTWQSAMGESLAGFNLYHAPSPAGPFAKLNQRLIPAQGDRRSYEWRNRTRGGPWYRLEAVHLDGRAERLPPQRLYR